MSKVEFTGLDEDVIKILLELEQNDDLYPERVVEVATDPSSPLHPLIFSEAESEAAYQHRVTKGRQIIKRFYAVVTIKEGETVTIAAKVRAVTYVPSIDRFKLTDRALRENGEEVHEMLLKEVRGILHRYESIVHSQDMRDRIIRLVQEF